MKQNRREDISRAAFRNWNRKNDAVFNNLQSTGGFLSDNPLSAIRCNLSFSKT